MVTSAPDTNDRFPTTGPDEQTYDRYRFDTTADGEALIYDKTTAEAWIQATWCVSLDEWR